MRKQWEKKEAKDAKLFNAKTTPRSGGMWFAKGDSKSEKFLIENKTTGKDNISINGLVWDKINKEALLEGRLPLLSIEFGIKKVRSLVVLDQDDFMELMKDKI